MRNFFLLLTLACFSIGVLAIVWLFIPPALIKNIQREREETIEGEKISNVHRAKLVEAIIESHGKNKRPTT